MDAMVPAKDVRPNNHPSARITVYSDKHKKAVVLSQDNGFSSSIKKEFYFRKNFLIGSKPDFSKTFSVILTTSRPSSNVIGYGMPLRTAS